MAGTPGHEFLKDDEMMKKMLPALLTTLLCTLALSATAQEAAIRKTFQESQPDWPKIDEVSKTPMPGLYEVRINGTQIFYTDAEGRFLIEGGNLIDLRQRRNLTEERVAKLTAISFSDLPLKDAFTVVRGNGKRKLAVFADPNCGFCKRLEHDLEKVDNVTIYTFIIPILGANSEEKSRTIWCAKDKAKAWSDWMLRNQQPAAANCDSVAITRNKEFAQKYKITGTPTLVFASGARVPGALTAKQIEQFLADNR
jgi:thiol:disulfide interchange protein DsbC